MTTHHDLVTFLRHHVPQRITLTNYLGGDGSVCCYYLCPFSTLRKITAEGIKCRHGASPRIDLSSPDVQSRRKAVWLGHAHDHHSFRRKQDVPIHSCVNFFWNPLNGTFTAFQRNALLRAEQTGEDADGFVCVVELDVEKLLNGPTVYWTVTSRNLASGASTSYLIDQLRKFPWDQIYAVGPSTPDYPWQPRAAELIVFIEDPLQPHTRPVPCSSFTRVILPSDRQLSTSQEALLADAKLPYYRAAIFKPVVALLKAEVRFVDNLHSYRKWDPECVERLITALRLLLDFEARGYSPTPERFSSWTLAHGYHGIGHVTRAMFWAAFLATYYFGHQETKGHVAAILAALLHDLGRRAEGTDKG
jgi:hypothetical protein